MIIYHQIYRCVQKGECNGDLISNIVEEDGKCSSESKTCCKEEDIKQVWFFCKVDSLTHSLDSDLSLESDGAKNHCCVTIEKLSNFKKLHQVFHSRWQLFWPRIILSENVYLIVILWICLFTPKGHTTVIIV